MVNSSAARSKNKTFRGNVISEATLKEYRATVIEKFINVEAILNAVICQHYFKKVNANFYLEVLYDEYFTFNLKLRIFEKIINLSKIELDNLRRLNTIRNYFAHCNQRFFQGEEGKVIDPRNTEKEINFENLYDEFIKKEKEVISHLEKTYSNLGGKF